MAPLVETPRTLTRSVAPAKDQRSVLMKGVGRQLHPRILRFGSRLSPASTPIATTAGADNVTDSDPQQARQAAGDAWSQCSARILRPDLRYRIHAPAATRNRADVARARRATPSISAGRSAGPARADANIAAAQPSQRRRNVPGSIRRFGRTPPYRSPTPPATGPPRAGPIR